MCVQIPYILVGLSPAGLECWYAVSKPARPVSLLRRNPSRKPGEWGKGMVPVCWVVVVDLVGPGPLVVAGLAVCIEGLHGLGSS